MRASQMPPGRQCLTHSKLDNSHMYQALQQVHNTPLHLTREVIKEVPVVLEVAVPIHSATARAAKASEDDKIAETKHQLITMLANERSLRLCASSAACCVTAALCARCYARCLVLAACCVHPHVRLSVRRYAGAGDATQS